MKTTLWVPRAGLEPARTFVHSPSNCRVYQFHHRGIYEGRRPHLRTPAAPAREPLLYGPMAVSPDSPPSLFARLRVFYEEHPVLGNFLLLAPPMVVILLLSIQSAIMEPSQRAAMVVATIGLAGVCAWIVGVVD